MLHSLNCECGGTEQNADHIIAQCPTHRSPQGTSGLMVLDDEIRCWLNVVNVGSMYPCSQHMIQAVWRPCVVKGWTLGPGLVQFVESPRHTQKTSLFLMFFCWLVSLLYSVQVRLSYQHL